MLFESKMLTKYDQVRSALRFFESQKFAASSTFPSERVTDVKGTVPPLGSATFA